MFILKNLVTMECIIVIIFFITGIVLLSICIIFGRVSKCIIFILKDIYSLYVFFFQGSLYVMLFLEDNLYALL